MSVARCKFQAAVGEADKAAALKLGRCELCSQTEEDLRKAGQTLEVCCIEHYTDLALGETIALVIPLCADCHRMHHLNAHMDSEPCPDTARRSWELLV